VDAGVPLAFGSDFPVEVESPLWGIHAALTRQDEQGQPPGGWHPEQRLSLDETLRGFTTGAAYASFDEQRLGAIKVGYRADVTLFDQDFFRIPLERIRTSRVTHTIVDGEIVHSANE
jgi:predicted amidohydrolase YtcJ